MIWGCAKLKRKHIRRLQGFCYDSMIFYLPIRQGFTVPSACANGFSDGFLLCRPLIIWCPGTESNRRHEDFQCDLDGANSKPLSQNQPIKYQSATVLSRSSVPFGTILCLRAPTNPCVNPDGLCQKTSRTRLDRSRATPGGENIPLLRIRAAHAHPFKLHITPSRYRPTEPKASCPSNHPRTIDRSAPFFFMAATPPPPVALQKAHGAGPPVRG